MPDLLMATVVWCLLCNLNRYACDIIQLNSFDTTFCVVSTGEHPLLQAGLPHAFDKHSQTYIIFGLTMYLIIWLTQDVIEFWHSSSLLDYKKNIRLSVSSCNMFNPIALMIPMHAFNTHLPHAVTDMPHLGLWILWYMEYEIIFNAHSIWSSCLASMLSLFFPDIAVMWRFTPQMLYYL